MAYNQHARSGGGAAVITQQPKQAGNNPFYDYHQQWTAGLGDCFNDMGQCCYAYFCWCCFMSSLAKSINEPATGCCFGNGILGAYRMKVRTVFKIQGDSYNDACAVCCCPFCVGLQLRNELTNRGFH